MKYNFIFLCLFSGTVCGQNVNNFLDAYIGSNAEGYLQPLADMTITGLNTGIQPSVSIGSRFHVRLSFNALSMMPQASQKTFMAQTDGYFTPKTTAEVPTIVGEAKSVKVMGDNGTSYIFSGGYGIKSIRWASPQLTFGGFYGTDVSIRFIAFGNPDGDFGKFNQIGVGLRHSVSQYFLKKTGPFAVNIGYQFNKADIGKYIKLQSNYAYVQAGISNKNIGAFVYGGYQMGTFDVFYTYEDNNTIKAATVNLKSSSPVVAGLGAHAQLGFFSLTLGAGGIKPLVIFGNIGLRFQSRTKQN